MSYKLGVRRKNKVQPDGKRSLMSRKLSRANHLHYDEKPDLGFDNKVMMRKSGNINLSNVDGFILNPHQNDLQSDQKMHSLSNAKLGELSEKLAFICERLKTVDEEDLVQTEWRTVAMTIDQMIFIVLAVICGLTILGCALYIPRYVV